MTTIVWASVAWSVFLEKKMRSIIYRVCTCIHTVQYMYMQRPCHFSIPVFTHFHQGEPAVYATTEYVCIMPEIVLMMWYVVMETWWITCQNKVVVFLTCSCHTLLWFPGLPESFSFLSCPVFFSLPSSMKNLLKYPSCMFYAFFLLLLLLEVSYNAFLKSF